MRSWAIALCGALTIAPALAAPEPPVEDGVERAALEFGSALAGGNAALLARVLPQRGKVRLQLVALGPEVGSYSGDQVIALFGDFLRHGSVRSFEIVRAQSDRQGFALVHGRLALTDREGKSLRAEMRLTFTREAERWVLREIRESPP